MLHNYFSIAFLSKCFNNAFSYERKEEYRTWWEIDTISKFQPEPEYDHHNYSISINDNFISIRYKRLRILEGSFELKNNRIYLKSDDLQKTFILFNGTKSFKNLIVIIDPLLAFASFHKKYTDKEWLNVIRTAKEYELGGRGAQPNIEKVNE